MENNILTFTVEIILTTVTIIVAVFIYRDAKKRRMRAFIWTYGAIIIPVISWAIYLIVRKPHIKTPCPDCNEKVMAGNKHCKGCQYNFTTIAEKRGLVKTYHSASISEKVKAFFTGLKYMLTYSKAGKDMIEEDEKEINGNYSTINRESLEKGGTL